MPYIIKVTDTFAAAHALKGYEGACERLHGHNFQVTVSVLSVGIDKNGISLDFKLLSRLLKGILDKLDHENLNELGVFKERNATAENIAVYIAREIQPEIVARGYKLADVTVDESARYSVTYVPET